ncbi:MAG: hypothetical protein GX099_06450 [Clostridiaceae bacterium]|jgi:tetratricopeptide (TPR) repeat protein|nr:hypothetical protein [Clostridiaceae bacterium]
MKIWEILDLPKTNSLPQIRKAFVDNFCSVRVQFFSVEGFLVMREAYIKAIRYARTGLLESDEIDPADKNLYLTAEVNGYLQEILKLRRSVLPENTETVLPKEVTSRFDDIVRFFVSMMALHEDFYGRIDIKNWRDLLQSDLLCDEQIVHHLRLPVLRGCAANPLLPQNVWVYLDLVFHWTDRSYNMPKEYAREKRVLGIELDPRWNLSFGLFKQERIQTSEGKPDLILPMWDHARSQSLLPPDTTDYELYATYRMNARNSIIEGNEQEAERNFVKAAEIFDRDPDLYVIYFEYLNAIKDEGKLKAIKELHLIILNRLLDFFPDHFLFLLSRAEINSVRQHPDIVISEYKKLMQRFPDSLMVIYQLSEVYSRSGQNAAAKKCLRQIEKSYASVQERLKSGRGYTVDPLAVNEQIRLNDKVFEMIQKRAADTKERDSFFPRKFKAG